MGTVIDFHSHILPGIDDGSRSLEESVSMLRMEADQGIGHVIATPHFYPGHDSPERFLRRRAEAERRLREELEKQPGLPEISMAAEVYYYSGMSASDALRELSIGQTRYLLVEMPHAPWTDSMYRELEAISVRQGMTPVIAHVDRYIRPFRTFGIPERLADLPVMVQANAAFFLHPSTRRMALRLLRGDKVHLLGSDCHNLTSRAPNLGAAIAVIEKHLGEEPLARLSQYGNDILRGMSAAY